MTGGFNVTVRGIEIDVTKTLNKFYNKNEKDYSMEEFNEFLRKNKLEHNTSEKRSISMGKPYNDGYVISFDFEGSITTK